MTQQVSPLLWRVPKMSLSGALQVQYSPRQQRVFRWDEHEFLLKIISSWFRDVRACIESSRYRLQVLVLHPTRSNK